MGSENPDDSYVDEQGYLQGEKLAEARHEYVDGTVYAMAGTSKRHNRIALNLVIALHTATQGTSCAIYSSAIKVHIEQRKSYYYPGVMVGCDPSDHADEYYLEKPCLIIEVLSPSTEKKDHTEKLIAYQDIETLGAYMMVDQDSCHISLIYRQDTGPWWVKYFDDLNDVIALSCPELKLKVTDIYQNIQL